MKFMNDWTVLALALGLLCGGVAAGRRMGVIATCWLAGGAWLAFRLADYLWRPWFAGVRKASPDVDLEIWLPLSYGIPFFVMLALTAVFVACVQPKREFPLPGPLQNLVATASGLATGGLLLLAILQAHIMSPLARERMPVSMRTAAPVLSFLGQKHVGTPVAPAQPGSPGWRSGG